MTTDAPTITARVVPFAVTTDARTIVATIVATVVATAVVIDVTIDVLIPVAATVAAPAAATVVATDASHCLFVQLLWQLLSLSSNTNNTRSGSR